jgi:hypothetical protein
MSKAASLREGGHENKIRGGNDSHAIECLLNWGAVDDEVSEVILESSALRMPQVGFWMPNGLFLHQDLCNGHFFAVETFGHCRKRAALWFIF